MTEENQINKRGAKLNGKTGKTGLKFDQSKVNGIKHRRVHHGDVTRIYLSEIGRANLLTADEEKSLARAAGKGCMASRQRMIECNLRLVVKVARSYINRGLPLFASSGSGASIPLLVSMPIYLDKRRLPTVWKSAQIHN